MTRLDLNLLRVLVVLMDERSVTRAAERLHLTQPAVSAALSRLRDTFDDPLFMPARRGVIPTPRAVELASKARPILSDAEKLITPDVFDPQTSQAAFVLGVNDFGVFSVVAPLLQRLRFIAPGVHLQARRLEGDISRQLESQDIDIAITLLSEPSKPAHIHTLFRESFTGIVRRDHPLIGDHITLDTFCTLHHVTVSAADTRLTDPVNSALAEIGRKRQIALALPSFFSVPLLLRGTDLISVAPTRLAAHFSDTVRRVHIPLRLAGFAMNMIWTERTHASRSHAWLRNQIARLFP